MLRKLPILPSYSLFSPSQKLPPLNWTPSSSNRFFFCKQFSQFNTFLLWKILVGIRLRMATFPNTVADGRSSGKALEKSNFSQTCSLLSKFLKEKRGSGDSVSGMGGKMDPKGTMIIFVSFFLVCYMKLKKKIALFEIGFENCWWRCCLWWKFQLVRKIC